MTILVILALILLAGCTVAPVALPAPYVPPPPTAAPPSHIEPQASPGRSDRALQGASQARIDASGYVHWDQSKTAIIDRLIPLTSRLNIAVAQMRAHAVRGRYRAADVTAVEVALGALRTELRDKGD